MEQAKADAEQQAQRAAALQERISDLGKHLSEGIQTLAASADLAEQSLPAADTLETEGLWQRYRQSVMQLIERLRTEQQTTTELQQAYRAEIAKLAEKDLELGTLQARLDSQTQQFAQFELIIEEQKNQLKPTGKRGTTLIGNPAKTSSRFGSTCRIRATSSGMGE